MGDYYCGKPTQREIQAASDVTTVQRSISPAVTVADGAKGILVPDNANLRMTTNDFSLRAVTSNPRWTENNYFHLINKYDATTQAAAAAGNNTRSIIVFNNKLYSIGSGILYEWDGVSAWVQKAPAYLSQTNAWNIVELNGELYTGTYTNGYLFKWNGTDAWVKVADQYGTHKIYGMCVFNNKIYGTAYSSTDGTYYLLEWDGVSAWAVKADMSVVTEGFRFCYNLFVLNNKLYSVTNSGALLEWNGSDAWLQKAPVLAESNCTCTALVYNYEIYICGPGFALYKWNGVNNWTKITDAILPISTIVNSMLTVDGEIYCTYYGHIIKYNFTDGWIHVQSLPQTTSVSIVSFAGDLYVVTYENVLYKFTVPVGYSLMKVKDRLVLKMGAGYYETTNSLSKLGIVNSQTLDVMVSIKRETAAAAGVINFFVNNQLLDTIAIPAGAPVSISDTSNLYLLGGNFSNGNLEGTLFEAEVFNYALSSADVEKVFYTGLQYSHKTGQLAALYTSNFSAGADSWSSSTGTVTGNIDGIDGQDDVLRWYANAPYSSHSFTRSNLLTISKAYRIKFDYLLPTANTHFKYLYPVATTFLEATDSWKSTVIEFTATSTSLTMQAADADQNTVLEGAGAVTDDLVYIKNFTLEQIGAVASWTANDFQPAPGQCLDSLDNKIHALQPESGSFLTQGKKTFEVRSTNTWAGTHEAQYLGGVNQKILPSGNIRITSITMRCSATGVNVVLGDGSDVDRFVASVALATRMNCTIANDYHDGTNMKMVIDPDGNYTGTIYATVQGIILE